MVIDLFLGLPIGLGYGGQRLGPAEPESRNQPLGLAYVGRLYDYVGVASPPDASQ